MPPPAFADVTVAQLTFFVAALAPTVIETPATTVLNSPAATATFILFNDTRCPPKGEFTPLVTRDDSKCRGLAECDASEQQV